MEIFKERLVSHLFSQHLGRIWIKSLAPKRCFKDKYNAEYIRIIWENFLKYKFLALPKTCWIKISRGNTWKAVFIFCYFKEKVFLTWVWRSAKFMKQWWRLEFQKIQLSVVVKMHIWILQVLREELRFFWISKRLPYLLAQTFLVTKCWIIFHFFLALFFCTL